MNIDDEKLSAFLDQELTAQEMDTIRDAVANDPALAERLTRLASADALLKHHARALDDRPMPAAVLDMLHADEQISNSEPATADNNVVSLSSWQSRRRRARQWVSQHAALAAGIALVVGFAGGQFISTGNNPTIAQLGSSQVGSTMGIAVSAALDSTLSGAVVNISDSTRLQSRFSFVDQQARHCRQFVLEQEFVDDSISATENIACHTGDDWQLIASAQVASAGSNEYQTASGNTLLDSALDAMMSGATLSLEQENVLIANDWQ